jgi:hypothetical protein
VLALAILGIGGAAHYPEAWVFLAIFLAVPPLRSPLI